MRSVELWVLFLVGALAVISNTFTVSEFVNHGFVSTAMENGGLGNINEEDDYPRIDPSPSSKAAVSSGPIEHGAPLMPYVPRATPPTSPRHGSPP